MIRFEVTAQAQVGTQRARKIITAPTEAAALKIATREVEAHGFYVVSIVAVR